jgi:superfamily I DNA and RNA helicase
VYWRILGVLLESKLEELQPGVYQMTWGTHQIRLIVLSEMPPTENNAIWNLFSGVDEKVRYGATQYYQRETDMSSIINQLFNTYNLEGLKMPYTMEDFRRDYVKEHIDVLSTDEILEHVSLDEILPKLSMDQILQRLAPDERLAGLSADEILQQLSPEDIRAYLEKQENQKK